MTEDWSSGSSFCNPAIMDRQLYSCDCLMGLVKYALNPISLNRRASPRLPTEVIITSLVCFRSGSCLISFPKVSPSIPGICMSITAISKGTLSITARWSTFKASDPPETSWWPHPHNTSCSFKIRRLVSLSSTMSTRIPLISSPTVIGFSFWGCFLKTAVNQNIVPLPSRLSTPISPPIISASCFDIVNPKPVPPYFRVVELSAWENLSKSRSRLFWGIPTPVSETLKRMVTWSASSFSRMARIITSPFSVNLMALPARLTIIWRRRPGSPHSSEGTSECIIQRYSSSFSWAFHASTSPISSKVVLKSKSIISRSTFPASIFDRSRISFIIDKRPSALRFMEVAYSCCSDVRSVFFNNSIMPMMPFKGVRISWLIFARKSDLMLLAVSACWVLFWSDVIMDAICWERNSNSWIPL